MGRYDVVIVGGGSAGAVLAARLTEDPTRRVLMLEAGRPDHRWDPIIRMPAALSKAWGNPRYDWCYVTEPEAGLAGRRIAVPRGKVLGGSSSINGMVYQRAHPGDYDRWSRLPGCGQWSSAHLLPYFRRLERRMSEHGTPLPDGGHGPQVLERAPAAGPLNAAFLAAAQQAGHALLDSTNGPVQEGFSRTERTISRGRRFSATDAWLHPVAASRPNLTVRTDALVRALRTDARGTRVIGVRYRAADGTLRDVDAGETLLAAGSIATPQLLQVSGFGDPEHLAGIGVETRVALPGVGANLQDHLAVHLQHACSQPISLAPHRAPHRLPAAAARWLVSGTGIGASNHFEIGGFASTSMAGGIPDVMMLFAPVAMRFAPDVPPVGHGYEMHVSVMAGDVRGTVRAVSRDTAVPPRLVQNYLVTDGDRRRWVEAVGLAREILTQPAFAGLDAGETFPGDGVRSDAEILDWVSRRAQNGLHPTSTARMGTDADAVVDPSTLRVHGTEGLRVVDASIFPDVPNANTYGPVVMVAERAADIVTGATPLPADPAPSRPAGAHGGPGTGPEPLAPVS
ncbi:choline dehydrogenase [Pseudonocardia alni subsp. carboxydivorans]|uniref:Choline dehydrogenase n=1 Tax=Pseudonocardia alni subsp. carboxydivorans TaxID=415010 RepID=A0ABU9ACJ0_PSEA5